MPPDGMNDVVDQGLSEEKDRKRAVEARLEEKLPPEEVNYESSAPEDSIELCGACKFYEIPGAPQSPCEIVTGEVQEEGTCDRFEPAAMDGQGQEGTAAEGMMDEIFEEAPPGR